MTPLQQSLLRDLARSVSKALLAYHESVGDTQQIISYNLMLDASLDRTNIDAAIVELRVRYYPTNEALNFVKYKEYRLGLEGCGESEQEAKVTTPARFSVRGILRGLAKATSNQIWLRYGSDRGGFTNGD